MESNLIPQVIRTYYSGDDRNLSEEYFQLNGKKEGEYKSYYDNGQLEMICNYVNNKTEGEYKEYYRSGQLFIICNYLNDKWDGEYKSYYENGNLYEHLIYSHGQLIQTIK